jgi:hypothetical protein
VISEVDSVDGVDENLFVREDSIASIRVRWQFTAGSGEPVDVDKKEPV